MDKEEHGMKKEFWAFFRFPFYLVIYVCEKERERDKKPSLDYLQVTLEFDT